MRHAVFVSCLLAVLMVSTACDGPAAPSATPAPSLPLTRPGASPNAIPIALGHTVSGVVSLSDPPCETGYGPEPCQRFAIAISTSGVLKVQVTSPGPSGLTLLDGSYPKWGVTALSGAVSVQAGSTYEISVALHDAVGGNTSQTFELTTSLEPF